MLIEDFLKLDQSQCESQTYLYLAHQSINHLDVEAFKAFCSQLTHCKNLKRISLEHNFLWSLDPDKFQSLSDALSTCPLEHIELGNNLLGELETVRCERFCDLLLKQKRIVDIDLDNNLLGILNLARVTPLAAVFPMCPDLSGLNLSHNNLKSLKLDCFKGILEPLPRCLKLKMLYLSGNDLGLINNRQYIEALGTALINCKELIFLDLSVNKIVDLESELLKVFFDYLGRCRLQHLNLCGNGLGNNREKLKIALDGLVNCKTVQEVDFSYNNLQELDEAGFQMFYVALKKCHNLFTIQTNELSEERKKLLDDMGDMNFAVLERQAKLALGVMIKGFRLGEKGNAECHFDKPAVRGLPVEISRTILWQAFPSVNPLILLHKELENCEAEQKKQLETEKPNF